MQIKEISPRHVGIGYETGEFTVFDQTSNGVFHGHVRGWKDPWRQSMASIYNTPKNINTRVKPKDPLQSAIDSALDQNWGNTATRVVTARVPAGTKIYEGVAAAQRDLVGGGNQVFIPQVNPNWLR